MSFESESKKVGRDHINILELDPDFCTKIADTVDHEDTTASYNDNLVKQSEAFDTTWEPNIVMTVAPDALTPPTESEQTWKFTSTDAGLVGIVRQELDSAVLTDDAEYVFYVDRKVGDESDFTILWEDFTVPPATRLEIDFEWTAGVASVKSEDVGTGGVSERGDGWYRCFGVVPADQIVAANINRVGVSITEHDVNPGGLFFCYCTDAMVYEGTAPVSIDTTQEGLVDGQVVTLGGGEWTVVAPQLVPSVSIQAMVELNGKIYGSTTQDGRLLEWNGTDAWVQVAPQFVLETQVLSLVVFNGKIYGGTNPNANLLEWNGANAWVKVAEQLTTETRIDSLVVHDGKLYGGAGLSATLLEWNGTNAWIHIADDAGADTRAYALISFEGDLYRGSNGTGQLYKWNGASLWNVVAIQIQAQSGIRSTVEFEGSIFAGTSTAGRLFRFDGTFWTHVADQLNGQDVIRSLIVLGGELYGTTSSTSRLFKWNGTNAWIQVAGQVGTEVHVLSSLVLNGSIYGGTSPLGNLVRFDDGPTLDIDYTGGHVTNVTQAERRTIASNTSGTVTLLGDLSNWDPEDVLNVVAAPSEYQPTEARDGTSTNITLTTGGMTIAEHVGKDAIIGIEGSLVVYPIVRNGEGYIRVTGDASGDGILAPVAIAPVGSTGCRATETANAKCYNTRRTCNAFIDWESEPRTDRFAESRSNLPTSAKAHATLKSVSLAPTKITPGKGLGRRAQVTCVLQDVKHHDRGLDPYVNERTYDPEEQGTFWGKWLQRNVYYSGRPMRILSGYNSEDGFTFDDFETRTYVMDQINGPDANGTVTVIGKDILKLADDDRAQAPTPSTGVLLSDIDDSETTLTLSPTGVGDSEYDATGTIRIGSEVMTFTRSGDVLTVVRPTDGTTAATHSAADSVQQCLRISSPSEIPEVAFLLLNTFAGIDASFLPLADWEQEVETKLGPHTISALITEPTGVNKLINEIARSYLLYFWWDERDSEVNLAVIAPPSVAPPVLTDASHIIADSVSVQEMPEERRSEVWVHFNILDPTGDLKEARNYEVLKIRVDQDAESAAEYGDVRVERIFSRWLTESGDVIRLGGRSLSSLRDNPRRVGFKLDAKDHGFWTGDIVTLDTKQLQDVAGANLPTTVRIIETRDDGHQQACIGLDENFDGRYARWGPNTLGDYDAASDDEKRRYGWIADVATDLGGDGAYKVG